MSSNEVEMQSPRLWVSNGEYVLVTAQIRRSTLRDMKRLFQVAHLFGQEPKNVSGCDDSLRVLLFYAATELI